MRDGCVKTRNQALLHGHAYLHGGDSLGYGKRVGTAALVVGCKVGFVQQFAVFGDKECSRFVLLQITQSCAIQGLFVKRRIFFPSKRLRGGNFALCKIVGIINMRG